MFDKKQPSLEIPLLIPRTWQVKIPSSKSLSNRALHLAALAEGKSFIKNSLQAIDTKIMIELWSDLGCAIKIDDASIEVDGCGARFSAAAKKTLAVENAGTAARFITAALALSQESFLLTGNEHMNRRPFDGLVEVLEHLGSQFEFQGKNNCTPFLIKGCGRESTYKKPLEVSTAKSSQFVSALLMVAPLFKGGLSLMFSSEALSTPYISMTLEMMRKFSASFEKIPGGIKVYPGAYQACSYELELDFSSASYFLALAAIHGTELTIPGARQESLQGDRAFVDILCAMGCQAYWSSAGLTFKGAKKLKGIHLDMKDISDLVPALCVSAMFARGSTVITGIDHMRYKECDRIAVLCSELRKFSLDISYVEQKLVIRPQSKYYGAQCNPHGDHRMAMTFAVLGTKVSGTVVEDPSCVDKTFPGFFEQLSDCFT